MDAGDLKKRTRAFALRCMKLADSLPSSCSSRAVANQLVRCGMSVGANYRAACRARSKAEFVAKMGIVEEEADECAYWLELLVESGLKSATVVGNLKAEAEEILKITVASIRTARPTTRGARSSIRNPQSAIRNS